MTDADFEVAEAVEPDEDFSETPPRTVAPKAGPRSTAKRLTSKWQRGKPSGKQKRKHPRVSTAELIGSAWRIGAKATSRMPPMYRVLRLESVVAGPVLDPVVKDTVVDTVLQPLARMRDKGEAAAAMLLPPAAIGAMAVHMQQTGGEPNPVVMQVCAETLRYGLLAMMHIGGDAFAAQLERERDDAEKYGASIDAVMSWIMAPPADMAAEDAAFAQMVAAFAGQPAPEPEPATMGM